MARGETATATPRRISTAESKRPTAIFATCDILAAGALQAIYEAGMRVPEDISLVGFDDTLALNLTPQLTTVAQPRWRNSADALLG